VGVEAQNGGFPLVAREVEVLLMRKGSDAIVREKKSTALDGKRRGVKAFDEDLGSLRLPFTYATLQKYSSVTAPCDAQASSRCSSQSPRINVRHSLISGIPSILHT
jgi:hypothetical protein